VDWCSSHFHRRIRSPSLSLLLKNPGRGDQEFPNRSNGKTPYFPLPISHMLQMYSCYGAIYLTYTHPHLNPKHRRILQEKIYRNPQFGDKWTRLSCRCSLKWSIFRDVESKCCRKNRGHPSSLIHKLNFNWLSPKPWSMTAMVKKKTWFNLKFLYNQP